MTGSVRGQAKNLLKGLLSEIPGARVEGDGGQASATLFYGRGTYVVTMTRVRELR